MINKKYSQNFTNEKDSCLAMSNRILSLDVGDERRSLNARIYENVTESWMDEEYLDGKNGKSIFNDRVVTLFTSGQYLCCYIHAFANAFSPTYRVLRPGSSDIFSFGNDPSKLTVGGFALKIKRDVVSKLIYPYFDNFWTEEDEKKKMEDMKEVPSAVITSSKITEDKLITNVKTVYYDSKKIWTPLEKKMQLEMRAYIHIVNQAQISATETIESEILSGPISSLKIYRKYVDINNNEAQFLANKEKFDINAFRFGPPQSPEAMSISASSILGFPVPPLPVDMFTDYKTYSSILNDLKDEKTYNTTKQYTLQKRRSVSVRIKNLQPFIEYNAIEIPGSSPLKGEGSRFAILPENYTPADEKTPEERLETAVQVFKYLSNDPSLLLSSRDANIMAIRKNPFFNGMNISDPIEMGNLLLSIWNGTYSNNSIPGAGIFEKYNHPKWYNIFRDSVIKTFYNNQVDTYNAGIAKYNVKAQEAKLPFIEMTEYLPLSEDDEKKNIHIRTANLSIRSGQIASSSILSSDKAAAVTSNPLLKPPQKPYILINGKVDPNNNLMLDSIEEGLDTMIKRAFRYGRMAVEYYKWKKNPPAPFDNVSYFQNLLRAVGVTSIKEYDPIYDARWMENEKSWARTCDLNVGYYCLQNGMLPYSESDFIGKGEATIPQKMNFDDLFNHLILANMNGLILGKLMSEILDVNAVFTKNRAQEMSGAPLSSNPLEIVYATTAIPNRKYVVIRLSGAHYETVGLIEEDEKKQPYVKTLFEPDHPFIQMFLHKRVEIRAPSPPKINILPPQQKLIIPSLISGIPPLNIGPSAVTSFSSDSLASFRSSTAPSSTSTTPPSTSSTSTISGAPTSSISTRRVIIPSAPPPSVPTVLSLTSQASTTTSAPSVPSRRRVIIPVPRRASAMGPTNPTNGDISAAERQQIEEAIRLSLQ